MVSIANINSSQVQSKMYDYALFSITSEVRSIHIFNLLQNCTIKNVVIFCLREFSENKNFQVSLERCRAVIPSLTVNNFSSLATDKDFHRVVLQLLNKKEEKKLRFFVDYSCMPRHWFAALPKIFDSFSKHKSLEITYGYSSVEYTDSNFPTINVRNLSSLSNSFGNIQDYKPKLVMLGLGFDDIGAEAFIQRVESEVLAFYTQPAFSDDLESILLKNNQSLLKQYNSFPIPVNDIHKAFELLEQQYLSRRGTYSIGVASLGPKIVTLLISLLQLKYREIFTVNVQHENINQTSDLRPIPQVCFFDCKH